MVILENDDVKVSISSKGAEINSIIVKATGTEHIWQADPHVWGFHAPNLFPIVGGLKDNTLNVNGKAYPLNRHGFARNVTFRRIESTPLQATFEYRYDTETLQSYPYKFEFQVLYHLEDKALRVSYKVINLDEDAIYFSVGAHPAFNVPFSAEAKFEDYYLEFSETETLLAHQLGSDGLLTGQTQRIETQQNRLFLRRALFAQDALVFKNIRSKSVTLKSTKSNQQVKVSYPNFGYLGIWTKNDAPFICIEPWLGIADKQGEALDISKKEGMQRLEQGHVFETDYFIEVGD